MRNFIPKPQSPSNVFIPSSAFASLMYQVFGEKSIIALAYVMASNFADVILKHTGSFPMLFFFGNKGSGKSFLGSILGGFSGNYVAPFIYPTGTKRELDFYIKHFHNTIAFIDEFKNDSDYHKTEFLKSIYNGYGVGFGNPLTNEVESAYVSTGLIICGQEIPNDDVALYNRFILLKFNDNLFEGKQVDSVGVINKWLGSSDYNNQVYTTLTQKQIDQFKAQFQGQYFSIKDSLLNAFHKNDEHRTVGSMAAIIASWRIISEFIEYPFSYENVSKTAVETIKQQNDLIKRQIDNGI